MSAMVNGTVPAGSTEGWREQKRYLWLIGLVVPSLAFIGYGLMPSQGGACGGRRRAGASFRDRTGDWWKLAPARRSAVARWADIPDAWCCPDCGVREKADFVPVERVEAP